MACIRIFITCKINMKCNPPNSPRLQFIPIKQQFYVFILEIPICIFFIDWLIHFTFQSQPHSLFSSWSYPWKPPFPITPFPFSERGKPPHGYHPSLAHQITVGWGASSPTEAWRGSPARRNGPKGRQQSQRQGTESNRKDTLVIWKIIRRKLHNTSFSNTLELMDSRQTRILLTPFPDSRERFILKVSNWDVIQNKNILQKTCNKLLTTML